MERKACAQISQRALLQPLVILFVLMMIASIPPLGGQAVAVGHPGNDRFPGDCGGDSLPTVLVNRQEREGRKGSFFIFFTIFPEGHQDGERASRFKK